MLHPTPERQTRPRAPWELLLLGAVLLASCAAPPPGLWPPAGAQRTTRVGVYATGFHSLIRLPARVGAPPGKPIEEWAYGERIWFCDDAHGIGAQSNEILHQIGAGGRALVRPNAGVIELSLVERPYPERNPAEKIRHWEFAISDAGLERMRAYLDQSIAVRMALLDDGDQHYYPARRPYDLFHTCHHYVAGALWEAGVPIHDGYCLLPFGFWWQLDRLALPAPGVAGQARRTSHIETPLEAAHPLNHDALSVHFNPH